MQSSFLIPSNCPPPPPPNPWLSQFSATTTIQFRPKKKKKLSFKPLTTSSSNSLNTSSLNVDFDFDFDFQEKKIKEQVGELPNVPTRLPVVIRESASVVSRYFWNGTDLQLVSVDGNAPFSDDFFQGGCRRLIGVCGSGVRNFFFPRDFNDNYLTYVKWKFLHRVFSSALQVLATQAMFRAIGVGYARSLPSAAALNWVLKDGLGRFCRCIYTASLASAFDTNLKRVRFSTSVMFSLSIGVELLTPAFPQYFLLLATVANIAKQISLACYLATGSAVHRSFAVADNLGELSAKAQIQNVCFDNLGLMLAAVLNIMLKSNQRLLAGLPFVVYPIFTAIDLYGIYQGLKHVHLRTLTKDRLEIIINAWIQLGSVPSPAEVSKEEETDFFWSKDKQRWPIRIGYLQPETQVATLSAVAMLSLNDEDFHFICMEVSCQGSPKAGQPGILLCMREGAATEDVITGLLQACYIRKNLLQCDWNKWEDLIRTPEGSDSGSALKTWFKLIEDSKQSAGKEISSLNEKMVGLGWACKNILLSTKEQARYSFVDD